MTRAADLGRTAERHAANYLRRAGLRIVERNYQCRFGEIDLIALHELTLVFVEVRFRTSSTQFASPAESVGPHKRQRLARAAGHYLSTHLAHAGRRCRFDVLCITKPHYRMHVQWIRNAFDSDE
ncbi:MAG: YraN family protein [Pseudomonadales bacterium]|nr:YraN family protein [Pseudomonadales bacterium]MDP6470870.1 YraN family protein [Pseudomonadales bacterium]MDP6825945.1 YraN family protein [Pseudomonadales bacterium]MDP6972257.1 YraN family protein [Pseudomonadales bacterium]